MRLEIETINELETRNGSLAMETMNAREHHGDNDDLHE